MARPSHDQWSALLDEADSILARLRRDGEQVLERARHGLRDGYPTTSIPGASGSGGISRPVESTVLARAAGDSIRRSTIGMVHQVQQSVRALRHADGARAAVAGEGDALAEVIPITSAGEGTCQACAVHHDGSANDRLRSGYGPDCYMAWIRAGRPDRAAFERDRRAFLEQASLAEYLEEKAERVG